MSKVSTKSYKHAIRKKTNKLIKNNKRHNKDQNNVDRDVGIIGQVI